MVLKGGMNLYRYAAANPVRVSGRLGLIAWDCHIMYVSAESLFGGPAGGGIIANCLSDCVNKKRVWALYVSTMVGFSVSGIPSGISYSTSVTLNDSTTVPSADSLNGPFALASVGAGIGPLNYSCTEYGIGSASGGNCSGSDFMVSLGFDLYAGGGGVLDSNTQCCDK